MTIDDLTRLEECKIELFKGIGQVLAGLDLGHLQIAGLELEPNSVKNNKDHLNFEKRDLDEIADGFTCPERSRPVLKVDPRTGISYYICVPDN